MSFQAKGELLDICASRYREATTTEKTVTLNELMASASYAQICHPASVGFSVSLREFLLTFIKKWFLVQLTGCRLS